MCELSDSRTAAIEKLSSQMRSQQSLFTVEKLYHMLQSSQKKSIGEAEERKAAHSN